MTDEQSTLLTRLLRTLIIEEELLTALAALSEAQQQALLQSAFITIESINEQMLAVASGLVPLEQERLELTIALGVGTLTEASQLAASAGVSGFGPAHERLRKAAARFRERQEGNAALVLNAMRLRDRWVNLLAGMISPTYGSAGKREVAQQRQIMSKSA